MDAKVEDATAMQHNFAHLAEQIRLFQRMVELHLAEVMNELLDKEQEINQRLFDLHANIHQ